MKKILALLLCAVMLFALTACGEKPSTPTSKGSPAADTVAVGAVILARDDVPTDEIYAFVSTIFENAETITAQHAKGGELDLDYASSVTSVPYHPGAAKYFSEKGKTVAAVKDGAGEGTATALTFGTGGDTGTYYAYGGVLASFVSSNTDYSVTAVTSGGSKANIEDLASGDVQIAFAQSDVMSYAYNGERLFDAPIAGFCTVAALYMEQIQIVTTNSAITSVADLKDKTVSVGASGSGTYFNALDVLGAYGMTEDDIKPVYQSFGDSADSLKDGKIDAAIIVAGAPTNAIVDLATAGPVYIVSLDKEHTDALLAASPFYTAYTIPEGMY